VLTISGGDNQSALTGTAYALPLQVTVTSDGLPVAGAVVQFDASKHPGLASLVPDSFTATTDANGVASATVTANEYPGAMEVSASYGGQTAIFHLSNIASQVIGNPNPYFIESRCEFNDGAAAHDPAANGNARVCQAQTTKGDCEKWWYCWWRDTAAQNALGDQTVDIVPAVHTVYSGSDLTALLYRSASASNVVALISGNSLLLVGAGGSRADALNAKVAFQTYYPGFTGNLLRGIVYTSIDRQVTWGDTYWRSLFRSVPPAPLIVSDAFETASDHTYLVATENARRDVYTYGITLTWGVDSFLGLGSGKEYRPLVASYVSPGATDTYISAPTDISLNGVTVTLIPSLDEIGGLSVWLPAYKILIASDLFGPYLPPIAPLNKPYIPIDDVLATLDSYRNLGPDYLIFMHGGNISNAQTAQEAFSVEHDALQNIKDETLKYIGYGYDVDDIVATVRVPANLVNSPYAQPWTADVAAIVRAVYHDYLGWFDGDPAHLNTIPSLEWAQRFLDLAGGEHAVLQNAKQAITEHSRSGAQWALQMVGILRQVHPSSDADDIYVQALKMLAYTTKNAPERNWYLTDALRVRLGLLE
jgi:hypothetical protein